MEGLPCRGRHWKLTPRPGGPGRTCAERPAGSRYCAPAWITLPASSKFSPWNFWICMASIG